jgi:predicted HAD superfamily phosphohydrolase YqeG
MTKNLQKFIKEEKKEFCKNNILSRGCEGVLDDLENTIIKAHNLAIDECLEEIKTTKKSATSFSVDIKNNYKIKDWLLEGNNIVKNIKKLKV